jgi:hypothetical protein
LGKPRFGYETALGEGISRDLIAEADGNNLYGYVLNNPIDLWDPLGLCRSNWDRAGQFLKGLGAGALGTAAVLGSVGPWAPLTAVSGAIGIQYGIGNMIAAFAPDSADEQAQQMEDAPSNLGGALGRAVGGSTGQAIGSFGEDATSAVTADNGLDTLSAELGAGSDVNDAAHPPLSPTPSPKKCK